MRSWKAIPITMNSSRRRANSCYYLNSVVHSAWRIGDGIHFAVPPQPSLGSSRGAFAIMEQDHPERLPRGTQQFLVSRSSEDLNHPWFCRRGLLIDCSRPNFAIL
jgi:hypothetical protein